MQKIKYEDFIIPTTDEIKKFLKEIPDLSDFGFLNQSVIALISVEMQPLKVVNRVNNLGNLNNCLINRFGKLYHSYSNMIANYNRGIVKDLSKADTNESFVNTFQFDFFAEIFYYYFFSSLDIIAYILKEYFQLQIKKERFIAFKKDFLEQIIPLKVRLIDIYNKLEKSRDIRNSFAHRFTPTQNNYKTAVEQTEKREIMEFNFGKQYEYSEIRDDALKSLNILSEMMSELREFMKNDTENNKFLFE